MISDFASKETLKIWKGTRSLKLSQDIQNTARRKLRMLNNAQDINELRIPPNGSFERGQERSLQYQNQ